MGSELVDLGDGRYRPARIEAYFSVAGERTFGVTAVAEGPGVKITQVTWNPDLYSAEGFDVEVATAALERATVIGYLSGPSGNPVSVRFGDDAPWLLVGDVRRFLAGPEGPARTGPERKASPAQVAKVVKAAARKGTSPAQAVAEAFEVSPSTAFRYMAAARKAGLIEEKK